MNGDSLCGEYAEYQRGCRCLKCRAANATYLREYRARTGNQDQRIRNRAVQRAAKLWREDHPKEWLRLLDEERRGVRAPQPKTIRPEGGGTWG
jgi:hypothetical protein